MEDVYKKIGGPLGEWAEKDHFGFSCVARVSYALNYGGMPIPKGTPNTYLGSDGKSYFINAGHMKEYFDTKWGTGINVEPTKIKNGIIFQSGFSNPSVSGHVDIVFRRYTYTNNLYNYSSLTTTLWH